MNRQVAPPLPACVDGSTGGYKVVGHLLVEQWRGAQIHCFDLCDISGIGSERRSGGIPYHRERTAIASKS